MKGIWRVKSTALTQVTETNSGKWPVKQKLKLLVTAAAANIKDSVYGAVIIAKPLQKFTQLV